MITYNTGVDFNRKANVDFEEFYFVAGCFWKKNKEKQNERMKRKKNMI